MRFRVLGPVTVVHEGHAHEIPAPKQRALLAALLTSPNDVASVDRLIDELWGDAPPRSANKTLQTYVSSLRRVVGTRIETAPTGYRLVVAEDEVDSREFERLAEAGRLALLRGDAPGATRLLGEGLGLWRGRAFDGVDAGIDVRGEAVRLDELRLAVTEDWFEARLIAGEHRVLTSELERLVAREPQRERPWCLLMQALCRSGRDVDALRAFQRARAFLVDQFGVEPGPELRAAEAAALGQDIGAAAGSRRAPPASYATNAAGLQIGYSTHGTGERDIVFLGDVYMNLELLWDFTELIPILDRLGDHRVVSVQRRGTGLSDRDADHALAPPQDCVDDVDAVLEAVDVDGPVTLLGWGHGGQVAIAFAAARPDRIEALVMVNSYARLSATHDYPAGFTAEALDLWLQIVAGKWGKSLSASPIFGSSGDDPQVITRVARLERLIASPRHAVELHRALNDFDVRPLLPKVSCPSLVVFLERSVTGRDTARWLAERLPSSRYLELPGYFMPSPEEAEVLAAEISGFLYGEG